MTSCYTSFFNEMEDSFKWIYNTKQGIASFLKLEPMYNMKFAP